MLYQFQHDVSYQSFDEPDEYYQEQFLKVFNMKEFNESEWRVCFDELFDVVIKNTIICEVISRRADMMQVPKKDGKEREYLEMGMIFLCSFECFQQFHRVLQDWNSGVLTEESVSVKLLKDKIETCFSC